MYALLVTAFLTMASGGPATQRGATPLDAIAEPYVKLVLALGEHDADYVDAYYGPEAWKLEAAAAKKSVAAIRGEAALLITKLRETKVNPRDPLPGLRHVYLEHQLGALVARADMVAGKRFSFEEESRLLYGVAPPELDESYFEGVIRKLEREVPGDGPLPERLESYRERFHIPPERVDAVLRRAMTECRTRTLRHIPLPAEESFTLEYVRSKPWSGYNWYKGGFRSVIQINTDLPMPIQRALDLACHEGYPGHHTYNVLLEKELVKDRGWIEYSVYPLFSPQSLIAEGSGNYGLEVAFPGRERMLFDRDVLFPLAGLDPREAARYHRILSLSARLAYAPNEAARRTLGGRLSRDEAVAWLMRYGLYSGARARQQLDFIERYRSYVINYNLGKDLVEKHVRARGRGAAGRWRAFREILMTPRVPATLGGK